MNNVNKTLYIPLYGKAYVSKKGIILSDKKAEEIWAAEGFTLKGKSKSKWLAYYMGMRSAVCDNWLRAQMASDKSTIIIHIGCGMDSRVLRVGTMGHAWYDVDFPEVIEERRRYYQENAEYHMVASDARDSEWLAALPENANAIVIMEGVSMYMQLEELQALLKGVCAHFKQMKVLMDCYTGFAAKVSKYKNPINDVGVTMVYGLDEPSLLAEGTGLHFVKEHEMTQDVFVNELVGMEKIIFKWLFGGTVSTKMYGLYEYVSK